MLECVRYARENGEIEFRIVDYRERLTLFIAIIKFSAYGGFYFHSYKNSMSERVWFALNSVEGIRSVIKREGGFQCHTSRGVRDVEMDTVEKFYYIVPGGVDEMISYVMGVVTTYYGDNYIER